MPVLWVVYHDKRVKGSNRGARRDANVVFGLPLDHIYNVHFKFVVSYAFFNPTNHQGRHTEGGNLDTLETVVNDIECLVFFRRQSHRP